MARAQRLDRQALTALERLRRLLNEGEDLLNLPLIAQKARLLARILPGSMDGVRDQLNHQQCANLDKALRSSYAEDGVAAKS